MEDVDRNRIIRSIPHNKNLRRLYEKHIRLEERLSIFNGRNFLTTSEQMESARLKMEKLRGVDRMMAIIRSRMPGEHAARA